MSATLLTGAEPAQSILQNLKDDVTSLNPKLVIVQVGNDAASDSYIRKKLESCREVGLRVQHLALDAPTTENEMRTLIQDLNTDDDVTGYIIQLPLPEHLAALQPLFFKAMDPKKDVDGFTAYNLGKLLLSSEYEHLPPATPAGIIAMFDFYNIDVEGKHVVIVGHSNIVGKPLAAMMLNRNATVTVCHKFTKDLAAYTRQADILCTAVGKPNLIRGDMVQEGAIVVDIGISHTENGMVGDCSFDEVKEIASAITPVPGGVGPMTVACLIRNVVSAKKRQTEK